MSKEEKLTGWRENRREIESEKRKAVKWRKMRGG